MKVNLFTCGNRFRIEFVEQDNGRLSAWEAYRTLHKIEQAAVAVTLRKLAETGRVSNREKFKKVEGSPLFEVKEFQHRFLGFFLKGARFVVASYEIKKGGKLKPATIERAIDFKQQMEQEVVAHAR